MLTQANLGEIKNNKNDSVCLHINIKGKKLVLGTLNSERLPQQLFDLVIDTDFQLSHNWKNGSVYFYGYKADQPYESDDSGDEGMDFVYLTFIICFHFFKIVLFGSSFVIKCLLFCVDTSDEEDAFVPLPVANGIKCFFLLYSWSV